jgi:hypothetical protein
VARECAVLVLCLRDDGPHAPQFLMDTELLARFLLENLL